MSYTRSSAEAEAGDGDGDAKSIGMIIVYYCYYYSYSLLLSSFIIGILGEWQCEAVLTVTVHHGQPCTANCGPG